MKELPRAPDETLSAGAPDGTLPNEDVLDGPKVAILFALHGHLSD